MAKRKWQRRTFPVKVTYIRPGSAPIAKPTVWTTYDRAPLTYAGDPRTRYPRQRNAGQH
jgi:hypothetical protein